MRKTKRFYVLAILWLISIWSPQHVLANDWCYVLDLGFTACYSEQNEIAYPDGFVLSPCHISSIVNQPTNVFPRTIYYLTFSDYTDCCGVYNAPPDPMNCFYNALYGGNPTTMPLNNALNNGEPACCNSLGDPINIGTGNVFRKEDDFSVGRWLKFSRYYNSSGSVTSDVIGQHWRHTYSRSLQYTSGQTPSVTIYDEDGRATTWLQTSTSPIAWGTFLPIGDDLTETTDSSGNPTGWTRYRAKQKSLEQYNAAGQLVGIQDLGGFTTTLQYSSSGLLSTVTDASGRSLSFTYNGSNQLTQVTLPSGLAYTYGYDTSGNLTVVTFPGGSSRHYLYNEPGELNGSTGTSLLTGIIDESGIRFETFSYDSNNRAVSNQQANGAGLVTITYGANNSATITDALGNTTTRTFGLSDGAALVTGNSAPCKNCSRFAVYSRDLSGNVVSTTDFNGTTNQYGYDYDNNQTLREEAVGTSQQRSFSQLWNTTFHLPTELSAVDANNNPLTKTDWVYNTTGAITSQCSYDATTATSYNYQCGSSTTASTGVRQWIYTYCTSTGSNCPVVGLLLTTTGPRTDLSQVTAYTYYANGDLHTTTDAMGHVVTVTAYDGDGHIKTIQDSNGVITTLTYSPRGWITTSNVGGATTTYTYTPYGAIQTVTDPDGVQTTYGYDPAHRLNKITDSLGNYIQYSLDAAGDKTGEQVYDNSGTLHKSLSRTFNGIGQLTAVMDGLGNTVFNATASTSYDENGNLLQSTDGLGTARLMSYDALNRLVKTIDNYGGSDPGSQNTTRAYGYDGLNRIAQITDPSGFNTSYSYDGLSDQTSLASPDTGTTNHTYDAAGNVLTSTDAKGVIATNTYDAANRLRTTTYSDSTQNITYSYDDPNSTTGCSNSYPIGRLTQIIEYSVKTVYCYDARGNITEKQQVTAQGSDVTNYTITPAGRLNTITYPSGTTVSYARDADGRIQSVTVAPLGGSASLAASNVTYLPFGPVSSYTLGNGQTISRTYDANYRLTDLVSPSFSLHLARDIMGDPVALGNTPGANPALETYNFDPLYRLTSIVESGGTTLESVTYNQTGDRLTEAGTGLANGSYTYNPNTHQLTGIGSSARSIDADGNTTAISDASGTYGFGYSARNRLTVVQLAGNTIGTYTYNALGQRIAKLVSGATDRFDYDEVGQIIGEYDTNSRDYVWMDDTPIANVDSAGTSSTVTYVTADQLGTPRAISSSTGATIWQWGYQGNPWGEQSPTSSGYTYNLQFAGQYLDTESGLSNNYFRDYDSTTGRYVQSDPIGLAGGISTYAYVGNNPLNYRDPKGTDGPGDMAGAFCPGGLCTLPPDLVQNSWGAPNAAPADILYGTAAIVAGPAVLAELGLSGIANTLLLANLANGIVDVPPAVVAGEMPTQEVLGQMYEEIVQSFEPTPPPPVLPVPTSPVAAPLAIPAGNQNPCPF